MNCCKVNLGEFPHNEDINTGIKAPADGTYKLILSFGPDVKQKKETELSANDDIIIKPPFLESALYKLQIVDPNGDFVTFEDCPNFTFKTYIQTTENCYQGEACEIKYYE